MSDWREQRASLGSGTGATLDSLKASQAAADQQVEVFQRRQQQAEQRHQEFLL